MFQMWIYSLGKTLDLSLNRTRTEVGSKSLRVVLELMTKVDPSVRSSLMTLFQVEFIYFHIQTIDSYTIFVNFKYFMCQGNI